MKKTRSKKSRDTVPLNYQINLLNLTEIKKYEDNKRAGPTLIHMEATSTTAKKIKANESQILQ